MSWTAREQQERHRRAVEDHPGRQHVTTRCLHCQHGRRFKFTGTLREGQAALAVHRAEKHPELLPLEQASRHSRRLLRGQRRGLNTNNTRRENVPPEELREREILRRMVRSDLPAIGR